MYEFREESIYAITSMSYGSNYAKDDKHPLVGHMSNDRCPQCSAKLFINSIGNVWCWNCDFREYVGKEKKNGN